MQPLTCYREYAPCDALRRHVRAYFCFVPWTAEPAARRAILREVVFGEGDSFCSPLFADGHMSMVLNLGRICKLGGRWQGDAAGPGGVLIGPMSGVGPDPGGVRAEMVGVYFHAARAAAFTGVPSWELTDQIVGLEDLWGPAGVGLPLELSETNPEDRIHRLESVLLARVRDQRGSAPALDVPGLAAWVRRENGRLPVESLAGAAGVSRQYLTRAFRDCIGLTPKVYSRLARFQKGLVHAGGGRGVNWAQEAIEMGYADQSHMIAEFRQFSSLTPRQLAGGAWFHPFIERARARKTAATRL